MGPPGSGKTVTINLITKELLSQNGIVIFCDHPQAAMIGLQMVRAIEPNRNIVVILEDIDEIIESYGEHELLALLDGENQVDNVVMVATTNYPERLQARIINRPSRFDEIIKVGMPSAAARKFYLEKITKGELNEKALEKWVSDTKGMSVAHLRELMVAVICLEQDYSITLKRLQSMGKQVGGETGFTPKKTGFSGGPKNYSQDYGDETDDNVELYKAEGRTCAIPIRAINIDF